MFDLMPWGPWGGWVRRGRCVHPKEHPFDTWWNSLVVPFHGKSDVMEDDRQYTIEVEVPGLEKEDLVVEAREDGTLLVRAEHREEVEEKQDKYLRRERRLGSFQRAFYLGPDADLEAARATCRNGILKLEVPKKKGNEGGIRRIEIK